MFLLSLYYFDFRANINFPLQINGCIKSCHKNGCSNNTLFFYDKGDCQSFAQRKTDKVI